MVFQNKNLTLELQKTSEYEKPLITPMGVIKDHYTTNHYNACIAVYKTNGDFISVATSDNRMKQVLERTHRMLPNEVRMTTKLAYMETYKVNKNVWAEIVEAHTKAPAAPGTAGRPARAFSGRQKDRTRQTEQNAE